MSDVEEVSLAVRPDRMVALVDPDADVETMASIAVDRARQRMPRVTSTLSSRLQPVALTGMVGIYFPDQRTWFLERGTRPFTMRNLPRNKAIPMWITDYDGSVQRENPKAKTRRTDDGRDQVLIFRRVAPDRSRQDVVRNGKTVSVPRSYPGAPGRIARRSVIGQIAAGNVGVRWRNPGISARHFMADSLQETVEGYGYEMTALYLCDSATLFTLEERSAR